MKGFDKYVRHTGRRRDLYITGETGTEPGARLVDTELAERIEGNEAFLSYEDLVCFGGH